MVLKSFEAEEEQKKGTAQNQLPLLRDYVKEQLEQGNVEVYEKLLLVREFALSKAKKHLKLYTEECLALLSVDDKLGKNILSLFPNLKGEGFAMCILPQKHGKRGFTVGADQEIKVVWCQDVDCAYIIPLEEKTQKQKELTLADFVIGLPELLEDGKKQTQRSKTKTE